MPNSFKILFKFSGEKFYVFENNYNLFIPKLNLKDVNEVSFYTFMM